MGREIAMIMNSSNRYPADLKKAHDELNKNIYMYLEMKKRIRKYSVILENTINIFILTIII